MRKSLTALVVLSLALTLPAADKEGKKTKKDKAGLQHNVTVTANRIETPARETASSVTIITGEDLAKTHKNTVLEALDQALGLSLTQNGPMGSTASVMIRGANSEHTLILLDGMELNDPISPARSSDLAHLTIEAIERIEILRGPQSLLYGSDAIGGVINIITHKGSGKPSIQLSTMAGSLKTTSGRALVQGGGPKSYFSLGAGYHQTSGFSAAGETYQGNTEKDGYKNLSITGNAGYFPTHNLELNLVFKYINSQTDIDNFGGPYGDDPNNIQRMRSLMVRSQAKASLLNNRWEQILAFSAVRLTRETNNPTDFSHPFESETGRYASRLWKLDWQHNLFLHETNTLMVGLDFQKEAGDSEYSSESLFGPYSSLFPQKNNQSFGIYVQDQIRLSGRFSATAGIRMNHSPSFGTVFTYRAAPAFYIPETETKLKASFGTGYKAPSLYQLYAPGTFWGPIGNLDLRPEESTGWDIGLEQFFLTGKLLLGVTYFQNRFKNLIQFDYSLGYTNIGLSRATGTEWEMKARINSFLLFRSGYTRTQTLDHQTGEELLRRPKDKLTAGLDLDMGKLFLNVNLNHTSRRMDMDYSAFPAERTALKAFTLLNSTVSFALASRIKIFLRMDNILNIQYELVKGYGAPGLTIFAGLSIQ
jgi:vitamin B12 transporter